MISLQFQETIEFKRSIADAGGVKTFRFARSSMPEDL